MDNAYIEFDHFKKKRPEDFKFGLESSAWNYIQKCHDRITELEKENGKLKDIIADIKFLEKHRVEHSLLTAKKEG